MRPIMIVSYLYHCILYNLHGKQAIIAHDVTIMLINSRTMCDKACKKKTAYDNVKN